MLLPFSGTQNKTRNQHEHGSKQSSEGLSRKTEHIISTAVRMSNPTGINYILYEKDMHVARPISWTLKKILQSSCNTVNTCMVIFPVWWHICMATVGNSVTFYRLDPTQYDLSLMDRDQCLNVSNKIWRMDYVQIDYCVNRQLPQACASAVCTSHVFYQPFHCLDSQSR